MTSELHAALGAKVAPVRRRRRSLLGSSLLVSSLLLAPQLAQADCGVTGATTLVTCDGTEVKVTMTPGDGSLTVTDVETSQITYASPVTPGIYGQTVLLEGSTAVTNPSYSGLVMQFGTLGDNSPVAVEVKADVTIEEGVSVEASGGFGAVWVRNDHAGDISIDNAGTITGRGSQIDGISSTSNAGTVTITNSGKVTSEEHWGIYADGTARDGDEGAIALVTNAASGIIESKAAGIRTIAYGGLAEISNAGSVNSQLRQGLIAWSASGDSTISNTGTVTSGNDNAIYAATETGDATVINSGSVTALGDATLDAAHEDIADLAGFNGLRAVANSSGDVSVTNQVGGVVIAGRDAAIRAETPKGDATVTNYGQLTGKNGIVVESGFTTEETTATSSIIDGDAWVINEGAITATSDAILVDAGFNLVSNTGTVTSSGGAAVITGDGDSYVYNFGRLAAATEQDIAVNMGSGENVFMMADNSELVGRVVNDGAGNALWLVGIETGELDLGQVAEDKKFSGFDTLAKSDSGTWTLTGGGSSLTEVWVEDGTLVFEGSIEAAAVTVEGAESVLAGSGTIGSLDLGEGATLSPGVGSIGTLSVAGDTLFREGSIYAVDLVTGGDNDLVSATGSATIETDAKLVLDITQSAAPFDITARYTVLSAEAGISGRFAEIEEDYAFLSVEQLLSLTETELALGFTRSLGTDEQPLAFSSMATRRNAKAAADAIDGMDEQSALYARAVVLTGSEAPGAFDQLTGEIHPDTAAAMLDRSRLSRQTVLARLDDAAQLGFGADLSLSSKGAAAAPAAAADWAFWMQGFGGWTDYEDDGNARKADASGGGMLLGADRDLGDWRVGFALGYGSDDISSSLARSEASVDSTYLAAYAGRDFGKATLKLGAIHALQQVDSSRSVSFGGVSETLTADYDATTTQIFTEGAWRMTAQGLGIEPFANLAYVATKTDGFSETGGLTALSAGSETHDQVTSTIGVRIDQDFTMGSTQGRALIGLGWRRAYGDLAQDSALNFAGSEGFEILSAAADRDALTLDLAMRFDLSPTATFSVGYNGLFGEDSTDQAATARLAVRF